MDRRIFISGLIVLPVAAAALPAAALPAAMHDPADMYSPEFFECVRRHAMEIVRREGRGIRSLAVRAPRDGSRQVILKLDAGPSLLDRVVFVWWQQ